VATREAMRLLPGLDDELIERIIAFRELEDISNRAEIAEIVPFGNLQELTQWLGTNTSNIYSIFVYPRQEFNGNALTGQPSDFQELDDTVEPEDRVRQAYMEIVEIRSSNALPRIYKVEPYGVLPDTAKARIEEYGIEL